MQSIAAENNLAETAFLVKVNQQYHIRWFTPSVEVDLCGHATLASAHVLCEFGFETAPKIQFYSHRSGELPVEKTEDLYTLDFPADAITEIELPVELAQARRQGAIVKKGCVVLHISRDFGDAEFFKLDRRIRFNRLP